MTDMQIAVIVLAAGGSRRLGQPKQLLKLPAGITLVEHTIQCAQEADLPVIVVTGAFRNAVAAIAKSLRCTIVHNAFWEDGMASSVRSGITAAEAMEVSHVILSVIDQPFLSADVFRQLTEISTGEADRIVTCRYSDTAWGPPTLFPARFFHDLKRLTGDAGARSVVNRHPPLFVTFEQGKVDIDQPGDLSLLNLV